MMKFNITDLLKDCLILIRNDITLFVFLCVIVYSRIVFLIYPVFLTYSLYLIFSLGINEQKSFKVPWKELGKYTFECTIIMYLFVAFVVCISYIILIIFPEIISIEQTTEQTNTTLHYFITFTLSLLLAVIMTIHISFISLWCASPTTQIHKMLSLCLCLIITKPRIMFLIVINIIVTLSRMESICILSFYFSIAWLLRDVMNKPPKKKQTIKNINMCGDVI